MLKRESSGDWGDRHWRKGTPLGGLALGLALQLGCAGMLPVPVVSSAAPPLPAPAVERAPAVAGDEREAAADPTPPYVILHTVVPGDSLWRIAQRYDVGVAALARTNGITERDKIRIGRVIRVLIEATPGIEVSERD